MGWAENMASTGNIFGIDVNSNMANTGNIFGIDVSHWGKTGTTSSGTTSSGSTSSTSSKSSGSSSSGSTNYAMNGKTQGYYDDAHGYLDKAWGSLDEAKAYTSGLTNVANQTLDAWNQYKTEYDPTKKAALSLAGQEYGAKSGYLSQLQNVDNLSYDSQAGKAGADVAQQAEIARQESARAMARQGVNAASGKSQALTQQGFLQEALAKAGAMTSARDNARDTTFNESLSAYNAVDPSKSVSSALAISSGANQLLGQYNDVMTTQAGLGNSNAATAGSLANTGAGLASSYGNTQLGYSKLNQQATSDAAQIGLGYYKTDAQSASDAANNKLGYYKTDKDYDISNRDTNLKETSYTDSRNDKVLSDAKAASSSAGASSGASSKSSSSSGDWKPLGAGLYNTKDGTFKLATTKGTAPSYSSFTQTI